MSVTGGVTLEANGRAYRLWLGMSVLADLQAEFGERFDAILSGIDAGKLPDLKVVHAIFLGALQRYHGEEADRWLVDDLIAQNADALPRLMAGSVPDTGAEGAKGAKPGKRKAAA